jgi:hypothetical protein
MRHAIPPVRASFCGRAAYRAGQFRRRLFPRVSSTERAAAAAVLAPAALALFDALSPGDQCHALCVLRLLRAAGPAEDALERAALLHDCGKAGGGLTLAVRVAVVLLGALPPGRRWLARLAESTDHGLASPIPVHGLRRAFYVHGHHAAIGAERCSAAGVDDLTVALVRHHDTPPAQAPEALRSLLLRLQAADDRC